jgi:hypothetical protein
MHSNAHYKYKLAKKVEKNAIRNRNRTSHLPKNSVISQDDYARRAAVLDQEILRVEDLLVEYLKAKVELDDLVDRECDAVCVFCFCPAEPGKACTFVQSRARSVEDDRTMRKSFKAKYSKRNKRNDDDTERRRSSYKAVV